MTVGPSMFFSLSPLQEEVSPVVDRRIENCNTALTIVKSDNETEHRAGVSTIYNLEYPQCIPRILHLATAQV